jgi:hypothetical protein
LLHCLKSEIILSLGGSLIVGLSVLNAFFIRQEDHNLNSRNGTGESCSGSAADVKEERSEGLQGDRKIRERELDDQLTRMEEDDASARAFHCRHTIARVIGYFILLLFIGVFFALENLVFGVCFSWLKIDLATLFTIAAFVLPFPWAIYAYLRYFKKPGTPPFITS